MTYYGAESPEVHRENVGQLLEHHILRWDQDKGGAWFIEDFMSFYQIWWTDFQKDVQALIKSIPPSKLDNPEELKKLMLSYIRPKMVKPGAKPKNTPSPVKTERIEKKVPQAYDYAAAQTVVTSASSKNEAMSRLRKMGLANSQIADFMKLKPGRVSSGIRAFDAKHK